MKACQLDQPRMESPLWTLTATEAVQLLRDRKVGRMIHGFLLYKGKSGSEHKLRPQVTPLQLIDTAEARVQVCMLMLCIALLASGPHLNTSLTGTSLPVGNRARRERHANFLLRRARSKARELMQRPPRTPCPGYLHGDAPSTNLLLHAVLQLPLHFVH